MTFNTVSSSPTDYKTVTAECGNTVTVNVIVCQVEATEVTFDHDAPAPGHNDGLSIYDVQKPEWVKDGQNEPAIYIKDTSNIDIMANFSISPQVNQEVTILATSGSSVLGNLDEVNSVFSSGSTLLLFTAAGSSNSAVSEDTVQWQWKVKDFGHCASGEININTSGPHTVYTTYGSPLCGASEFTKEHIDWACDIANNANTITSAAVKFRDAIASDPGYDPPRVWNLNSWQFLASGEHGDCITLAKLAREGLQLIGIPANYSWSYPTADGTTGFPSVSGNSCRSVATKTFQYQGESFNAKLVYPGNNFEGFFTVSDPDIKAYTVYTPGGAFENQTYYYLEVLQFAAGQGGDQFWVWNGTQTKNNVTVTDWESVPGAAHIPVPSIP